METGEGDWIWRSRRRGVSLLVAQLEVALGLAPEACLGWGLGQRNKWREGGREGGVEDTWEPQEMGMQRDRKGCQRSSAAELGMRLRDWIWGK